MNKEQLDSSLRSILIGTFKLSGKKLEHYLSQIFYSRDNEAVENILTYLEFFKVYDTEGKLYNEEIARMREEVLKRCIKIFDDCRKSVKLDFFDALEAAKVDGINPFCIAVLENLRHLSATKYTEVRSLLTETEFENPITREKFKLLNRKEFKDLVEKCSSIITKINMKNLKEVVETLAEFEYNPANDSYFISPAVMVQRCGMLLSTSPEKIKSNIEYLKKNFCTDKESEYELAKRIGDSPSILLLNQKIIDDYTLAVIDSLEYFRENYPKLFEGQDFNKYVEKFVGENCLSIDKLSTITGLDSDAPSNIRKNSEILVRFLGEKNAFSCFENPTLAEIPPEQLEGILAGLTASDIKDSSFKLRSYIVKHTTSAFEKNQNKTIIDQPRWFSSPKSGKRRKPTMFDIQSTPKNPETDIEEKDPFTQRKVKEYIDKIKNKAEHNSEEEDEKDMSDYINFLQDEYKPVKDCPPFIELLDRERIVIDSKMGEGYADSHFNISKIQNLYKRYLEISKEGGAYKSLMFQFLKKAKKLEDKSKTVANMEPSEHVDLMVQAKKLLTEFFKEELKVDECYKDILRLLRDAQKFTKSKHGNDDRKGNKVAPIKLSEISRFFLDYQKSIEDSCAEVLGFEVKNAKIEQKLNEYALQELPTNDLALAIGFKNLTDNILVSYRNSDSHNTLLENLANPLKNLRIIADGRNSHISILNKAPFDKLTPLETKLYDSIDEQVIADHAFFDYLKYIDKCCDKLNPVRLCNESRFHRTAGGFIAIGAGNDNFAVFFKDSSIPKEELDEVGIKEISPEDAKEIKYVMNSITHNKYLSDDDKKALAPVNPINAK